MHCKHQELQPNNHADPVNYTWDPLDSDLLARLSLRKYVSLSRERRLNIPPEPIPASVELARDTLAPLSGPPSPETLEDFADYIKAQVDPPELHAKHRSVFEARTPGAMTLEEIERDIRLGEWKIRIQGIMAQLQVSHIRGIYNPIFPLFSLMQP